MKKAILAAVALSLLATPAALAQSYKHPQGQPHYGSHQSESYKDKRSQERYRHGKPDFEKKRKPAAHKWQRGHKLPHNYRKHVVRDYHRYHLKQPPRGHQWVRSGSDAVLVAYKGNHVANVKYGVFR